MSYHPAEFGGYRTCDSEDIMVLICRVILHEHLAKRSSNFTGGDRSR